MLVLAFCGGLFLGVILGMFFLSLLISAKASDEHCASMLSVEPHVPAIQRKMPSTAFNPQK